VENTLYLGCLELWLSEIDAGLPKLSRREMAVVILVVTLEVVLVLSIWNLSLNSLNDKFERFVSPLVLRLYDM